MVKHYMNTLNTASKEKVSLSHFRIVITAGMGFFTDAYDLFIIGVVTAILAPIWHLSPDQLALLNGASLAAAALGAVTFGKLADLLGRKKMYGVELAILFLGAIASAVAPNFVWLLVARLAVGFGIGGDYPTSAVVASEHSTTKHRGFLVLLVFAMQALGLIVGPLLASLFLSVDIPHTYVWRLLLVVGAIPAGFTYFLRRRISETPYFLNKDEAPLEASRVVADLTNQLKEPKEKKGFAMFQGKWLKCLIGTAGSWFLLDVAFYGNGISSVTIMKTIAPHADLLQHTLLAMAIFLVFAVPGYFIAATYVDRMGRKKLQTLGFIVMAICYAIIALVPGVTATVGIFVLVFGISFFFVNFGPNSTTFLIPSEVYPTKMRATGHGLSAAIGKVGAFIGAFFLPIVLHDTGIHFTIGMMAIVAVLGVFTTRLLPEMAGKPLEN